MAVDTATADGGIETPLEDVMIAMDVVDTVRHRQILIDRELDADARRVRLRDRLRDLYTAQGIEVTDDALDAGIAALEEERFRYQPTESGFSRWLALRYVNRARWGKRVAVFGTFAVVTFLVYLFSVHLPERRLRAEVPDAVQATFTTLLSETRDARAQELAGDLNVRALAAIARDDYATARVLQQQMATLLDNVRTRYEVRIVSRPDEMSGVWRIPDANEGARNYYLIVEAVTPSGNLVTVPILSEETGRETTVSRWGVRVSEATFSAVAADRSDDGIIQNIVIGEKPAGQLEPEYSVPTPGGYITSW